MRTAVDLAVHDVAGLFPMMGADEIATLAADIAAHGLREPIWLHPDGSILDGRNRLQACQVAGVAPSFRTWDGHGSPAAFVVSLNLHRRHLSESQRAMVAARIATLGDGQRQVGKFADVPTQAEAAQMLAVSERSVRTAREVLRDGSPELVQAVERGGLTVSAAVTRIPRVVQNSGDDQWYSPAAYVEAARRVLGGIDLDPASSTVANEVVRATRFYSAEDDGLTQPWAGRLWLNPPYTNALMTAFADRLLSTYRRGDVTAAILLSNNATDTAWFHLLATEARSICFPRGRAKYWRGDTRETSSALQGQAVLYFGPEPERFDAVFGEIGLVGVLRRPSEGQP